MMMISGDGNDADGVFDDIDNDIGDDDDDDDDDDDAAAADDDDDGDDDDECRW